MREVRSPAGRDSQEQTADRALTWLADCPSVSNLSCVTVELRWAGLLHRSAPGLLCLPSCVVDLDVKSAN